MTTTLDRRVEGVRRFNRFYTQRLGVLTDNYLRSPYTLAETRVLWELAQRETTSPGDLAKAVGGHMTKCPSPITVILFTIFTGPNVPAVHPDAAYSMSSRVYGGPWTMWKDAADDAANSQWHDECTALLRPFNIGYYVGESDTVHRPSNAVQSLSPENWKRLADLRDKYDPDGVFFGYFDGLLDPKPS